MFELESLTFYLGFDHSKTHIFKADGAFLCKDSHSHFNVNRIYGMNETQKYVVSKEYKKYIGWSTTIYTDNYREGNRKMSNYNGNEIWKSTYMTKQKWSIKIASFFTNSSVRDQFMR